MNVARRKPVILPCALLAALVGACDEAATQRAADSESIFGAFTPQKPIDAAKDMINPYDADKRYRGTNAIANAPFGGGDVYLKVYEDQIKNDPDTGVRAVAARALSLHGRPEHAQLIIPLLAVKDDRRVRIEAARALQRIHADKAVDPLIAATDPKREFDHEVRAEAATALGQYPQGKVAQALIAALDDDHLVVNIAAHDSLRTLTGQSLPPDRKVWLSWLTEARAPFADQRPYVYPVFNRDKTFLEYLPFVPPPPNETAASPVGMPPVVSAGG
ncbi:MAG: HEAT repeat domain-containing protein [Phycisphaerales bacterium]